MFFGAAYLRERQKYAVSNQKGRHVNIFMVIPHNLQTRKKEIFKNGLYMHAPEEMEIGKTLLYAAYEIDMQMLCEVFLTERLVSRERGKILGVLTFSTMMMHVLFACKHDKNSN